MKRSASSISAAAPLAGLLALAACDAEPKVVADDFDFDGTCVRCHDGLSSAQVHPTFKLRCVDCHGGDDQVEAIPEDAHQDESVYRDPDLVAQSHVQPKPGLARFFFANGVDDDGDGQVDEAITFDETTGDVVDFGEIVELGLQGQGAGEFVDSELNRDLNYVRWLNPGDLRVATVGCGSRSRPAMEGSAGGSCHQSVIARVRRSMMVNQGAVVNGAYYGNESWRARFQEARDDQGAAADPRAGAFGYVLDYAGIDGCIDTGALGSDQSGRAQARFDSDCLEDLAAQNDPNAVRGAGGNAGLPPFEATQGTIVGSAPGTEAGQTLAHQGAANPRYDWGGKPLMDPAAALPELEAMPDEELEGGVPDPIDLVLRGFRAYYPLNYPGSGNNFNFTFGESILPGIATFETRNPFGRGHSSGCTSCHMSYRRDGARETQQVREVDPETGEVALREVRDPTTRHREFRPAEQDIVNIDGEDVLIGMTVNRAERIRAVFGDQTNLTPEEEAAALAQRPQQRFYSQDHTLDTRVTTDQCGLCHAFVTRIDYAYQGIAEDEQRDLLARIEPIDFTTPAGTPVRIHDSWVREEALDPGDLADKTLVLPSGVEIARLARERDAELAAQGLTPGFGGCAPSVFTEDCNNNGELDSGLTLERVDERGEVVSSATIDEDLNGNGVLDLLSHVPRERSVDGRQLRYVYGGANGSTRLMDIHYERGMACIDCHMIQDAHGDGNIYSTNWDAIEIECEDCHGAAAQATLFTSGPNGGNDLRGAVDHDGRPYFEAQGGRIIQRSRVTPGLFWEIPQTAGAGVAYAHDPQHMPPQAEPGAHNTGSSFDGPPGRSELSQPKLECYSCHSSWVLNCLGCHDNANLGDQVKKLVEPDGSIRLVAGENETWFNNKNQAGRTNFQLLEFMRSPFVLGVNAAADGHRVSPFRSSMQVHVSVTDQGGDTLFDSLTFTTFQEVDANSGRENVATSGAAMNQTMPHTVRPKETRSCETCHSLVDDQGRVRNDHILAQTYGLGAGRYPYLGDWAFAAGDPSAAGLSGLELYEYKQENQLAGSAGVSRFPGIIVNPSDRVAADVEPLFDGDLAGFAATDAALVRNFNPTPRSAGETEPPTLRDLAIVTATDGAGGALVISDVTSRGHPALAAQPSSSDANEVFVLTLPGQARALAHLAPDVSDPFVYVADGDAGLTAVRLSAAPNADTPAAVITGSTAIPGGLEATEVALAGDVAYVGTTAGTIEVFDLADPRDPAHVTSVDAGGGLVRGLAVGGFHLYAATASGLAVLKILEPLAPTLPDGAAGVLGVSGINMRELFFSGGHVYVAAGAEGVLDIDVTAPSLPQNLGDVTEELAPGESVNAADVVVSKVPMQTWLLVLEASGDLVGLKLDRTRSTRERCLPDGDCGLDMDWRDPTIMGRDPSFDPQSGTFNADDPSGAPFFRIASSHLASGSRLARPALWEKISTQTGRRYRDSFMPGAGVLSLPVMQRMYGVEVCELEGTEDENGNGLGTVGIPENGQSCAPHSSARALADKTGAELLCEPPDPDAYGQTCELAPPP